MIKLVFDLVICLAYSTAKNIAKLIKGVFDLIMAFVGLIKIKDEQQKKGVEFIALILGVVFAIFYMCEGHLHYHFIDSGHFVAGLIFLSIETLLESVNTLGDIKEPDTKIVMIVIGLIVTIADFITDKELELELED